MQSLTLDLSCALNFLNAGEEADPAVVSLVRAAIANEVDLAVTDEAFAEIELIEDAAMRVERGARLAAFPRVRVQDARHSEVEKLAEDLLRSLFPKSKEGTRTYEHNRRDCRQLAAHKVVGRSSFVTRDARLLRGAAKAAEFGIVVKAPSDVLPRSPAPPAGAPLSSVVLRSFDRERDEGALREVLHELADDYPDFNGWLTRRIGDPATRIILGEIGGQVAAAALTVPKDSRVHKLAAFYVSAGSRDTGLGKHLLWNEMRHWVEQDLEKVYVTVSSRKAWLLRFFASFGFLLEGVSARRYGPDRSEMVLGKHLMRRRITEADREAFGRVDAPVLFSLPVGVSVDRTVSAAGQEFDVSYTWAGEGRHARLLELHRDAERRGWSVPELEAALYPAHFPSGDRQALLVPIEQQWAAQMVEFHTQQQSLLEPSADERRLLLRTDNVYYAYPKSTDAAEVGAPILLYVKQPIGAVIGDARLLEVVRGEPDELFGRFGGLGVYTATQIAQHVIASGPRAGTALALKFGRYLPYRRHVSLDRLHDLLGRDLTPQGLTPVSYEEYETIRRTGGVEW